MDEYCIAKRVLTAKVSEYRVWGRPRLDWVDGVKVASGIGGMEVEAARQFGKDRKRSRTMVHM